MTSLLNIAGNIPVSAAAAEEGQSLRFEDGDSPYLSWTPASAGNRKTWTWSGWVKRGNLGGSNIPLFAANSTGIQTAIRFRSDNVLQVFRYNGTSYNWDLRTTPVYRDVSAWMNVVVAHDTTESTSSDRIKIWINGVKVTSFGTSTYPSSNYDSDINRTYAHGIGGMAGGGSVNPFDGYLANVCFIDGTALDPTSFGEYEDTLWKPKSDADITGLTFGTNGFYLPFKQTTEAEGFSTVTYTGNGGTQSIEGVGFEPDLVWLKGRTTAYDHQIYDSVRGATERLRPSLIEAESTQSTGLTSFDSSGFTLGSLGGINNSSNNYVAWCWDAGSGSAASNTDGSITSTVKANTAKGFSIATYTGDGTSGSTFGHGLGVVPELIIVKRRNGTSYWNTYTSTTGATKYLELTTTAIATTATNRWNNTAPTSSVVTLGNTSNVNGSGSTYVAYSFASVSGYSSIGSYSGTGAAGNSITGLGFKPAWLMYKRSDSTGNWIIHDNTRDVDDDQNKRLYANLSNAEQSVSPHDVTFDSDGFTMNTTGSDGNASGGTYIYMAFADTRDATFFGDTSGNGNNWTPNALNNTDVVPDSPVTGGNFATYSPIDTDSATFSEGNLSVSMTTGAIGISRASMAVSSGKWYWENLITGTSQRETLGIALTTVPVTSNPASTSGLILTYGNSGNIYYNGSDQGAYMATYDDGDIIGIAFDADAGSITYYKNGVSQGVGYASIPSGIYAPFYGDPSSSYATGVIANFGQDSSFAGNETPQGNTDDNGVGDFYYAPPSGHLALATSNLPTPTITAPDEYFNTVLYTGNSSTQSITGVGFQPDWVWGKERPNAEAHWLFDSVRGATKQIASNATNAESTQTTMLTSFDSDGFTMGSDGAGNQSSTTYVAWNWLAGGTAVSNTDGSITSSVSANTDAGFSVVSYTGTGSQPETVGHGLGVTPNFIIVKDRDAATNWHVFHSGGMSYTNDYKFLRFNTTDSLLTAASAKVWYAGDFTSTVFGVGIANGMSSRDYIAYCFAEVEGYSKFSSFEGNGGTTNFVHCGFRPAWVMIKCIDSAREWIVFDNKRNTYNVATQYLYPNRNYAEGSSSTIVVDFLSNGFNLKGGNNVINTYGQTLIFAAFAEAPFKSANAR
jgi:hypothetical protein